MTENKKRLAIMGGGAAGLALACFIDTDRYSVTVYERNKTLGRKMLVAGKGGFNLTHSEPLEDLMGRYTPAEFLEPALSSFSNDAFCEWLHDIGVPTIVGSSKRIFPTKDLKPIEVLNSIIQYVEGRGVSIKTGCKWKGWTDSGAVLVGEEIVDADVVIYAMGGGSWKVTGSDGNWTEHFERAGIKVDAFSPSNCAMKVDWASSFIDQYEGRPLKNVCVSCDGKSIRGDVIVTRFGVESTPIYALSGMVDVQLVRNGRATIAIDLKPDLSLEEVTRRLVTGSAKMTKRLKDRLGLDRMSIALLKMMVGKSDFLSADLLPTYIKDLSLVVTGFDHLDKAISTRGGVSLDAVDARYQLLRKPGHYAIGEMVAWDAPTGGYLLQACFSMGHHLAQMLNEGGR